MSDDDFADFAELARRLMVAETERDAALARAAAAWRAGVEAAAGAVSDATRASGQRNAKDQWREGIGNHAIAAIRALVPPL